jgi:hypothetical protein
MSFLIQFGDGVGKRFCFPFTDFAVKKFSHHVNISSTSFGASFLKTQAKWEKSTHLNVMLEYEKESHKTSPPLLASSRIYLSEFFGFALS